MSSDSHLRFFSFYQYILHNKSLAYFYAFFHVLPYSFKKRQASTFYSVIELFYYYSINLCKPIFSLNSVGLNFHKFQKNYC